MDEYGEAGGDAYQVIWLRSLSVAGGGSKAKRETKFIVEEKITTAQEETMKLIMGGSPNAMVKNYRRKLKANKRRLSK